MSLSYTSGLCKLGNTCAPRLQDMRYTYAVETLIQFYRDGVDMEFRLPPLVRWLGHTGNAESYWHVSAVPELMQLVAQKLDQTQNGGDHGS